MKKLFILIMLIITGGLTASTFYMQVGKNHKNSIIAEKTILTEPIVLSCTEGVLNEVDRTCTSVSIISAIRTCPSGYYNYNSTTCYKTVYSSPSYSCPSGYTSYSGQCLYRTGYAGNCPSGYSIDWELNICWKDGGGSYVQATCDSGLIQDNQDRCLDPNNSTAYISSCSGDYTFNGTNCEKDVYRTKDYSCSSGYTLNASYQCETTVITNANIVCSDGYTYNEEEDICKK